jgi:hypothetical protein
MLYKNTFYLGFLIVVKIKRQQNLIVGYFLQFFFYFDLSCHILYSSRHALNFKNQTNLLSSQSNDAVLQFPAVHSKLLGCYLGACARLLCTAGCCCCCFDCVQRPTARRAVLPRAAHPSQKPCALFFNTLATLSLKYFGVFVSLPLLFA